MTYEAIINGQPFDTIDPIYSIRVIINNGAHDYEYDAENLRSLTIREMPEDDT